MYTDFALYALSELTTIAEEGKIGHKSLIKALKILKQYNRGFLTETDVVNAMWRYFKIEL